MYCYSLISLQPAPISEVAYVGQVSYLRDAFQAALSGFPTLPDMSDLAVCLP
jgi:hypothetical protein